MKKMLLPMLVLAAGIAFSAFKVSKHESKKVDGQLWYDFVGTHPDDPSDYFLRGDGSEAPPCDANTTITCAVLAQPNQSMGSDYPDLSDPAKITRFKNSQ